MLDNLNPVSFQSRHAARMVGHKPDVSNIEVQQDLSPDSDLALCCSLMLQRSLLPLFIVELQRIQARSDANKSRRRLLHRQCAAKRNECLKHIRTTKREIHLQRDNEHAFERGLVYRCKRHPRAQGRYVTLDRDRSRKRSSKTRQNWSAAQPRPCDECNVHEPSDNVSIPLP
jgi:hypothetical protein